MRPRSRRVELDTGLGAHVLEWGGEDTSLDHTVVLVHGFLDLAWGWQPTVEAGLAGRFHVVAPDARGHGDSDRVGAGGYYHFFDYVADLASLVERVGRSRVSLVGHSMGGTVCGYLAGTFPQRFERIALLEGLGPPEDTTPMPERMAHWIASWRQAGRRAPRTYTSIEDAAERLRKRDERLDEDAARFLAEAGTRLTESGERVFRHDPLHLSRAPVPFQVDVAREFWRRIEAPVLLVEGAESRFRYDDAERQRRHAPFPGARQAVIEGAGHMMQRHRPAELAALLASFLERRPV